MFKKLFLSVFLVASMTQFLQACDDQMNQLKEQIREEIIEAVQREFTTFETADFALAIVMVTYNFCDLEEMQNPDLIDYAYQCLAAEFQDRGCDIYGTFTDEDGRSLNVVQFCAVTMAIPVASNDNQEGRYLGYSILNSLLKDDRFAQDFFNRDTLLKILKQINKISQKYALITASNFDEQFSFALQLAYLSLNGHCIVKSEAFVIDESLQKLIDNSLM